MRRRRMWLSTALVLLLMGGGHAWSQVPELPIPHYEPRFLGAVNYGEGSCLPESQYDITNDYGNDCTRLKFVFGPVVAKPGQNDVLIQPITFEKPMYDGYMVRNKPNLVDATGETPNVEDLHLHHGTWLNNGRNYGSGPFWASGEEKTVLIFPENHGIRVLPDDQWLLLHMVHNATPQAFVTYITYEMDYIPIDRAEARGFKNTRQIWLDVGGGSFHPQSEPYLLNPVFNIQQGFGQTDTLGYKGQFGWDPHAAEGGNVCYFPDQNCARFNSAGNVSAQQGLDVSHEVQGRNHSVNGGLGTADEGTLVVMGGHLHPGGVRTEVTLVRPGVGERLINISDAVYWDHEDPSKPGGPPVSWDLSMTGSTKDIGWSVRIQRGDFLRLNGVYETDIASWYEQMGIVMTWVVPGDTSGIDVFDPNTTIEHGFPDNIVLPEGLEATCTPSATNLCTRGQVTRPSERARQNHSKCPPQGCAPLPEQTGQLVDHITIQGFNYGVADLGVVQAAGIPQVKLGEPVRFTNLDTGAYIWHTVTRCKEPCTGPTSASYPLADGGLGDPTDEMDFDSSELGYGLAPAQRADWEFTPTATGVYSFWCRIHPSMRGAFKVVE
jgi:plastocyanin